MGCLGYDKWAALDSDDDEPRPKVKAVRKQAVHITRAGELAEAAEESRQAAAELAQLQERAERLQQQMEKAREQMLAAGGSEHSSDSETPGGSPAVADDQQRRQPAGDGTVIEEHEAESLPEPAKLTRRSMDREREVDEERIFEARPAPDGGRGQSIAAELRIAATASGVAASKPDPTGGEATGSTATGDPASKYSGASGSAQEQRKQKKSSLRRLKQLDQEVTNALQRECGMNLSKADVFRLVMENPGSHLKQHTSVLVVAAGEAFLCPEPAPGKLGAGSCPSSSSRSGGAVGVMEATSGSPPFDSPPEPVPGKLGTGSCPASSSRCGTIGVTEATSGSDDNPTATGSLVSVIPLIPERAQASEGASPAEPCPATIAEAAPPDAGVTSQPPAAAHDMTALSNAAIAAEQALEVASKPDLDVAGGVVSPCTPDGADVKSSLAAAADIVQVPPPVEVPASEEGKRQGKEEGGDVAGGVVSPCAPDDVGVKPLAAAPDTVCGEVPLPVEAPASEEGKRQGKEDGGGVAGGVVSPRTPDDVGVKPLAATLDTVHGEVALSVDDGKSQGKEDLQQPLSEGGGVAGGVVSPGKPDEADVKPLAAVALPVEAPAFEEGNRQGKAALQQPISAGGGVVKVDLRFFRATPKLSALARKIGKVPILHIAISTGSDLDQCLEFIGIHQRRYCSEEPPCDAIAQNLVESLLRVALEFIFHPTRSKYLKERLLLRECSRSAEALKSRDDFLPRMVDNLRSMNKEIREVEVEFCTGSQQSIGTGGKRDRSFLILDEDALKVAPIKGPTSKAPPASKSFRGLGKGFLNTEDAKRNGLSTASESGSCVATVATADAMGPSVTDNVPASERTRINPVPETDGPPPISTTVQERQALVLPAADLHPGVPEDVLKMVEPPSQNEGVAESDAAAVAAEGLEDGEGQELSEQQQLRSLSELADQLFGDLAQQTEDIQWPVEESGEEGQTASTELPSPTATSSRDGGAASERSERGEAAGSAEVGDVPAAGLRLLQQRRRERGKAEPTPTAPPVRDESEDLVNLWMKQRW